MNYGMMFGEIVCSIVWSFVPISSKVFLLFFVLNPMQMHVPGLWFFSCILLFTYPAEVELSVLIGVGPYCWCPIDSKIWQSRRACLALWKTPWVSASAAKVTNFLMVLHLIRRAPLSVCLGLFAIIKETEIASYLTASFG